MKYMHHTLRIIFGILLLMPAAGGFGFMPAPTADMYSSAASWNFMSALMTTGYMMPLIGVTCLLVAILLFINKTAIAAVILTPFTVNVILFHLFLDASPISASAIPAYILVILNAYFLYKGKHVYKQLV